MNERVNHYDEHHHCNKREKKVVEVEKRQELVSHSLTNSVSQHPLSHSSLVHLLQKTKNVSKLKQTQVKTF